MSTDDQLRQIRADIWSWAREYRLDHITPAEKGRNGLSSGDSVLFSALLYFSGEEWAGRSVARSQGADGQMWRAPQRVGKDSEPTFSRDHLLGALLYMVTLSKRGRKAEVLDFGSRLWKWIALQRRDALQRILDVDIKSARDLIPGEYVICKGDIDHCSINRTVWGHWGKLMLEVFRFTDVPHSYSAELTVDTLDALSVGFPLFGVQVKVAAATLALLGIGGGKIPYHFSVDFDLNEYDSADYNRIFLESEIALLQRWVVSGDVSGFHDHLCFVAALILREIGREPDLSTRCAEPARRNPNPLFLWAAGEAEEAKQVVLKRAQEIDTATRGQEYAWQRPFGEAKWTVSFGWDFILIINLMLGDTIATEPPVSSVGMIREGAFVRTADATLWRVIGGTRRRYENLAAAYADRIIEEAIREASAPFFLLPEGSTIRALDAFPPGTIVGSANHEVGRIENGSVRFFKSRLVLEANGFTGDTVRWLDRDSLDLVRDHALEILGALPQGLPYVGHESQNGTFPDGVLLRLQDTLFRVESGRKRRFSNDAVFNLLELPWSEVQAMDEVLAASLVDGLPLTISDALHEGELLGSFSNNSFVAYRIQDNCKRRFLDADVFAANGFAVNDVRQVPPSYLDLIPDGSAILQYEPPNKTYPDGTALRTPDGNAFLIEGGHRRQIISGQELIIQSKSKSERRISSALALSIPAGPPIDISSIFHDGTKLSNATAGTIFLIEAGRKRLVPPNSVTHYVPNRADVLDVTAAVLAEIPDGGPLPEFAPVVQPLTALFPNGSLLADAASGNLYKFVNGQKQLVPVDKISEFLHSGVPILDVTAAVLADIPDGPTAT